MVKWTILPFVGPAQTLEARSIRVTDDGGLEVLGPLALADPVIARVPREGWAHFRQGELPFKDTDPQGVGNDKKTH